MPCRSSACSDWISLRHLVNATLCEHEHLELEAFPLTEQVLNRNGRACGMFFCLHGPRSVRITAIWEIERNVVLFYGSTGERFATVQLLCAPPLPGGDMRTTFQHQAA